MITIATNIHRKRLLISVSLDFSLFFCLCTTNKGVTELRLLRGSQWMTDDIQNLFSNEYENTHQEIEAHSHRCFRCQCMIDPICIDGQCQGRRQRNAFIQINTDSFLQILCLQVKKKKKKKFLLNVDWNKRKILLLSNNWLETVLQVICWHKRHFHDHRIP